MTISEKVSLFYGADAQTFYKADLLRKKMTREEELLWQKLKDRTRIKHKFRRQHPVNIYIADFYCHPLKLVIEIDSGYHLSVNQKNNDSERTKDMDSYGLKIIRFNNSDLTGDIEKVVAKIEYEIQQQILKLDMII